jgi:glycine C-acetyltransferase
MAIPLEDRLASNLSDLERAHLRIRLTVLESPQEPVVTIGGQRLINLSSNNYLGLCSHPDLKRASIEAVEKWGVGAGAVRTIAGTLTLHEELEERLARFKNVEATLVLQSGFATNQAVINTVTREGDVIFSDELNHASIIDGCRLSKARTVRWAHKDMGALEDALEKNPTDGVALVITDGVFSMDGDIAPLTQIVEVARRYGAIVMVDDAHGSGVLGKNGKGSVNHFGLDGRVAIQVGTLSKAWGAMGGYAAGSRNLREALINAARPFLFSTSHPPAVTASLIAALDLVERSPELMERLWANTKKFKAGVTAAGLDTMGSETPITPILIGEADAAFEFSRRLRAKGVFAGALGFPTVPRGKARLRAIVTAAHTDAMLDQAVAAIGVVARELKLAA